MPQLTEKLEDATWTFLQRNYQKIDIIFFYICSQGPSVRLAGLVEKTVVQTAVTMDPVALKQ